MDSLRVEHLKIDLGYDWTKLFDPTDLSFLNKTKAVKLLTLLDK